MTRSSPARRPGCQAGRVSAAGPLSVHEVDPNRPRAGDQNRGAGSPSHADGDLPARPASQPETASGTGKRGIQSRRNRCFARGCGGWPVPRTARHAARELPEERIPKEGQNDGRGRKEGAPWKRGRCGWCPQAATGTGRPQLRWKETEETGQSWPIEITERGRQRCRWLSAGWPRARGQPGSVNVFRAERPGRSTRLGNSGARRPVRSRASLTATGVR